MDCQACNIIHVLGPYALVLIFAIVLARIVKRHHEHLAQLHARTLDVFERQSTTYERVHLDLVALKTTEAKDVVAVDAPKKR